MVYCYNALIKLSLYLLSLNREYVNGVNTSHATTSDIIINNKKSKNKDFLAPHVVMHEPLHKDNVHLIIQ